MTLSRAVPILTVSHLDASARLYRESLGVELLMDHGWIVTLGTPGEGAQFSLMEADATAPVNPVASLQVSDLDGTYARVRAAGLEIIYEPTEEPWGVRRFFFRDDSGNVINVLEHTQ